MEDKILVEDYSQVVIYRIPYDKLPDWQRHCEKVYMAEHDNSMGESKPVPDDPEWAEKLGMVYGIHY